mmetsp:Transcript_3321/g.11195  ORF Transcript_3321/g.11195 Transcript_3321/m.11195 type:complete len:263 (-) Transcript_3321:823-1611(-)
MYGTCACVRGVCASTCAHMWPVWCTATASMFSAAVAPWHHGQAGRQTGKGEREREIGRVEPVWNQYVYVVDKPPSAARAPALSPPPAPLPPTATAGCGDTASALPSCGVSAAHPARARCPNTIESIVVVIGGRSGVGGLLLVGEAGPHSLAPADGDGTAPTAAGGGRTASWTARTAADGPATPVSPAPAAGSAARRRIARCSLACLCPSLSCFVSIAHERSDREQPGAFPRSKGVRRFSSAAHDSSCRTSYRSAARDSISSG